MSRKPFKGLKTTTTGTLPVRYHAENRKDEFWYSFGFVDTKQEKLSKSWKRIVAAAAEGREFDFNADKHNALNIARK